MGKKKVTVIGAGNVGATCAQRFIEADLADVVLIDVADGLAEGKALDMMQSAPILGFEKKITGTMDFTHSRGSDIIIITAGLARKPGMSRDDLLNKNAGIVKDVVLKTAPLSPKAVIIIVTNPLDVMCAVALKYSHFPRARVIGMAGELDAARFSHCVRMALGAKAARLSAIVLGTHGDAMVPLPRLSKVGNKKVDTLFSRTEVQEIISKTQNGGAEIVGLLKTGSAYYAPSAGAFAMARSILTHAEETFCSSVYLEGEYGITDVFCGVPVTLGRKGVSRIIELKLDETEAAALKKSAEAIRVNTAKVKDI
jgi:malate dehydrogenase